MFNVNFNELTEQQMTKKIYKFFRFEHNFPAGVDEQVRFCFVDFVWIHGEDIESTKKVYKSEKNHSLTNFLEFHFFFEIAYETFEVKCDANFSCLAAPPAEAA